MDPFQGQPLVSFLSFATIFFIMIERMGDRTKGLIKVEQNKLLFGLFVSIVLSHLSHTYLAGLIDSVSRFVVIIILYLIVLNTVASEVRFKVTIWTLVLLNVALVFQGIHQTQFGYGWAGQGLIPGNNPNNPDEWRIKWIGIFSDPNDLALTFCMAAGIVMSFVFSKAGFTQKMISIPALFLLIYGIFLTNSRGGMLALMAMIFFYFVKRTKKFIFGSVVGGLAVIGLLTFGPSRMALLTVSEESAYTRIDLWYEGIMMLKANPLFGVGFNMFTDQLPQTAHNSYILAAAELGFLGLFFFMGLIYVTFRELSIIQQGSERFKNYAFALQSALIGYCTASFFLSRAYVIIPYLIFALTGSLFYVAQRFEKTIQYEFNKREIKNTFWLSVGTLVFIYGVIKWGLA